MDFCRKVGKHFSSTSVEETNLFLPSTRARCLSALYSAAKSPERSRKAEEPEPSYLCIPIQTEVDYKYFNVETETKRVGFAQISTETKSKFRCQILSEYNLAVRGRPAGRDTIRSPAQSQIFVRN